MKKIVGVLMLSTMLLTGCSDKNEETHPKATPVVIEKPYVSWENLNTWEGKDVMRTPLFNNGVIKSLIDTIMSPTDIKTLQEAQGVMDTLKHDPSRPYLFYLTGNKIHAAQDLSFYVIINQRYQNIEIGLLQHGELIQFKSHQDSKTEYPLDVVFMLDNLISFQAQVEDSNEK